MTYTVRQQLLDPKRYSYPHPTKRNPDGSKAVVYKSFYAMTPKYITVHNTYNDASAANEANYHNRIDNHNSTTFHIAVDDKEVVQLLPFNRNGYHAGDGSIASGGNRTSIGIEICYSKSGGAKYVKAEENAVHYIASLLKQYGWGVDRLRQHYDWSKKNCPHRIRDEKRWASFVARVKAQLDLLNKPVAKPIVQAVPKEKAEVLKSMKQVSINTLEKEMKEEIKKAVQDGRFSSPHDVDSYDKETLTNFFLIALKRRKY